jgi:hypothetical protein
MVKTRLGTAKKQVEQIGSAGKPWHGHPARGIRGHGLEARATQEIENCSTCFFAVPECY